MDTSDAALDLLARRLGEKLREANLKLATAESCTGGWISKVITDIAGSSEWFECGFVTYSNAAKQRMLGVRKVTLATHGAVCEATAREMVTGALAHSNARIALAVTGIAGPDGAAPGKPVGTIWFAWSVKNGGMRSACQHFKGGREDVRRATVAAALQGMLDLLDG